MLHRNNYMGIGFNSPVATYHQFFLRHQLLNPSIQFYTSFIFSHFYRNFLIAGLLRPSESLQALTLVHYITQPQICGTCGFQSFPYSMNPTHLKTPCAFTIYEGSDLFGFYYHME
jgi:hypothetical protein